MLTFEHSPTMNWMMILQLLIPSYSFHFQDVRTELFHHRTIFVGLINERKLSWKRIYANPLGLLRQVTTPATKRVMTPATTPMIRLTTPMATSMIRLTTPMIRVTMLAMRVV